MIGKVAALLFVTAVAGAVAVMPWAPSLLPFRGAVPMGNGWHAERGDFDGLIFLIKAFISTLAVGVWLFAMRAMLFSQARAALRIVRRSDDPRAMESCTLRTGQTFEGYLEVVPRRRTLSATHVSVRIAAWRHEQRSLYNHASDRYEVITVRTMDRSLLRVTVSEARTFPPDAPTYVPLRLTLTDDVLANQPPDSTLVLVASLEGVGRPLEAEVRLTVGKSGRSGS